MPGDKNKPAGNTTVTQTQNTAPWAAQQPYLQDIFGSAQNLYQNFTPQYYPGSTVSPSTAAQNQGLNLQAWLGNSAYQPGTPLGNLLTGSNNFENSLLSGQYMWQNPALAGLSGLAGQNIGASNAGTGTLQAIAGGQLQANANPILNAMDALAGQNSAYSNPAFGTLAGLAQNGVPQLGGAENLASGTNDYAQGLLGQGLGQATGLAGSSIAPSQAMLAGGVMPAANTLGQFASGRFNDPMAALANPGGNTLGYFSSGAATDPFLSSVAQSTLANVVPSIQSQFIQGGGLSSPQAAYATSQGATAALAPVISNALLQEQQNQLQAGGALQNAFGNAQQYMQGNQLAGGQALGNLGINASGALQNLSLNPAQLLGSLGISGANTSGNLGLNTANTIGNLALGGANLQANVGNNLGSQILQGTGLQQSGLNNVINAALGFGGLQANAANQLGQQALAGAGLQESSLGQLGGLYNQGVGQMLQGLGMTPQQTANYFTPAQMTAQAGSQQQALNQQQLTDLVNRFNFSQTLPYNQLSQYLGEVGGNYGSTGSGSQSTPFYQNQGANLLSGGLSGALLGSTLFGGGTGATLGGAGVGGLLALLSDRRLKREVEKVGQLPNGLTIYRYRFWGDPREHIGLIADEVREWRPEAVITGPYGFDLVDYAKAIN